MKVNSKYVKDLQGCSACSFTDEVIHEGHVILLLRDKEVFRLVLKLEVDFLLRNYQMENNQPLSAQQLYRWYGKLKNHLEEPPKSFM